MSTDLLFSTLNAQGGRKIGVAVLNRPDKLNGLTLEMCRGLNQQLDQWAQDDAIALVVLTGKGDRAFCAGGDLHRLHACINAAQPNDPWSNTYAREFFAEEYRLDYRIHQYPKPVLCWASGIVMGGGVGLMMGASHRVATETTSFAMPEITIGAFPDVGASWMLERLPAGLGVFLALTGARLAAADCRYLGLVDYCLYSAGWPSLKQGLQTTRWSNNRHENDVLLDRLLRSSSVSDMGSTALQPEYERVAEQCDGPDFEAICRGIRGWQDASNTWLVRAAQTFVHGSPGSARLAFTLQKRARGLSLAQVFQMEYTAMLQCAASPDFREGIRALLVDKDMAPQWQPASIEQADEQWVEKFFVPSWPADTEHPLADLGACA
ncbi:MAG TPA: enoyl-CoA hydratase/isomerase family protein [Pusillimonas sp.]|uniref:enoyl-CoA hydratase/isomerase family protein n=1 Tax=Pusillimonas sp. TaxID=3040095 RepID=UPI002C6BF87E|nr:enoyl-CoA hydratase/isomerase family protein [Pusillimonas sp.]HUH86751.1 enoyl-CoA hydratase/isomerase family protein [Pusillimonas sp.]